jgi:hypothetical protein
MANSVQKKIKFSKGQVAPELVERTDLELYNSSAQEMTNVVSTVYGGVRSRRGTKYCSKVYGGVGNVGIVTNNMGGTSSYIQDFANVYETDNISSSSNIFTIDYESQLNEGNIVISKIKMTDDHKYAEGNQTFTLNEKTDIRIKMCGAGGGAGGGTYGDGHKTSGGYGGQGAIFDAIIELEAGSYTVKIGTKGTGGSLQSKYAPAGTAGGDSTLVRNSDGKVLIRCGGGAGGTGRGGGILPGSGGVVSYSVTVKTKYSIKNGESGSNKGAISTYGAGGAGVYKGAGQAGTDGYCFTGAGFEKVKFSKSINNSDWEEIQTVNIGKEEQDVSLKTNNFRYIKADIIRNTSFSNITGTMSLNYVRSAVTDAKDSVKMIPFIFNNEQVYILVLANGRVSVFEKGNLIQDLNCPNIQESYIKDIKYTTKDDTIILVHKDMPPQQIKRDSDGFSVSDFPYKNIPIYAFNGEKETSKTIGITPSALEGAIRITAKSDVFDSSYVGNIIDGNGGRVRITEYVSKTAVNGVTIIPFYTTDEVTDWKYVSGYEPVWGEKRGYPRTCLFAQQRLWFGGSRDLPSHLWASRLGDYNNFKNAGNYDNDSIDVTLLTNNPILNLIEQRGLHIFTSGEEWTVSETSYTPDEITVRCNTKNGSIGVTPVVIDGSIMYVEKNGKSLLGYTYSYEDASYNSTNLSMLNNLINKPIDMSVEINSNTDRGNFLFMVMEDGTMAVGCISLTENIFSLSKYVTNGKIRDICCLPSETYLIVERNGKNVLEKITDDDTDMTQNILVNGNTITNMEDYKGMTVAVYDDKSVEFHKVLGDEITLTRSQFKYMNVGIVFDYKIVSNPISINNQTMTCKKRISKATVFCKNTKNIEFNGQKKTGGDAYSFFACTPYKDDVRFEIKGRYYPMNILSITLNLNFEG